MEKCFREPNTSMKTMDERYQQLEYIDTDTGRILVNPTYSLSASNLVKKINERTNMTLSDIVLDTVARIRNRSRVESSAQRRIPLFHCLPMCIKRRGTATIVEWCDGTVTKIVRQKDAPGDYSIFEAFCVAYAKKMFGSKSTLERVIRDADEQTQLKHRADMEAHNKKLREEENNRKARKRAKRKQKKEATYHE